MASDCAQIGFVDRVLYCPPNESATGSNSNLGAALSVASATLAAQVIIFICVRSRYKGIYSPKAHLVRSNRILRHETCTHYAGF